jgi:hypothetical protein
LTVRTTFTGEGFLIKNILHWRGDWIRTTAAGEEDEGFLRATFAGEGFTLRAVDNLLARYLHNNCSRKGLNTHKMP